MPERVGVPFATSKGYTSISERRRPSNTCSLLVATGTTEQRHNQLGRHQEDRCAVANQPDRPTRKQPDITS